MLFSSNIEKSITLRLPIIHFSATEQNLWQMCSICFAIYPIRKRLWSLSVNCLKISKVALSQRVIVTRSALEWLQQLGVQCASRSEIADVSNSRIVSNVRSTVHDPFTEFVNSNIREFVPKLSTRIIVIGRRSTMTFKLTNGFKHILVRS